MLHLEGSERLEALHRKEAKSGDHMRFVKYTTRPSTATTNASPSQTSVMLIPHTDFGSLTLLISNQPGLQLMDPETNVWKFVEPRPGSAIVNAGDALAKFSNGLLKACQHRVIEVAQAELELFGSEAMTSNTPKYSLGYFLRPEDNVLLRRLNSDLIPELADPSAEVQILSQDWETWRRNSAKAHNYGRTYAWEDLRGTAAIWT
jgi:isopenicillin N synthase-like dioxygenase